MIPRLLTLLVWLLWASPFGVHAAYAKRYGDLTFAAPGQSLADGNNTFTVIASNAYNVKVTNNLAFNLPQSITLTHDLNGNVSGDRTRVFYHDAEDRLTNVFIPGQWKTEFVYDGLGRRRIIKDYTWQGGAWVKTNETRVIFDGMLPIQERDGNNVVRASYTRGLDLSLSLDGAGGIGGLLARTDANGSTFYHSDGMGNVTALIDNNQNIVARYLYDPFGRALGKWGPLTDANVMRFSSMPHYGNGSIVGYWGRFYDPALQRWIQQDPIREAGGLNLYEFVYNNPGSFADPFGLYTLISTMPFYGQENQYGPYTMTISEIRPFNFIEGEDIQHALAHYYEGNGIQPLDPDPGTVLTVMGLWEAPVMSMAYIGVDFLDAAFGVKLPPGTAVGIVPFGAFPAKGKPCPVIYRGGKGAPPRAAETTGAENVANGVRLNNQLTADEIAGGHAFDKHVVQGGEFPGITTSDQFSTHIENIINNPSDVKILSNGRTAYWDDASQTVIIRNPSAADGGTAFKPTQGKTYFNNLK